MQPTRKNENKYTILSNLIFFLIRFRQNSSFFPLGHEVVRRFYSGLPISLTIFNLIAFYLKWIPPKGQNTFDERRIWFLYTKPRFFAVQQKNQNRKRQAQTLVKCLFVLFWFWFSADTFECRTRGIGGRAQLNGINDNHFGDIVSLFGNEDGKGFEKEKRQSTTLIDSRRLTIMAFPSPNAK